MKTQNARAGTDRLHGASLGVSFDESTPDLDLLETLGPDAALAAVEEHARAEGCAFGEGERFVVDPVPRVLTAAEWASIARGAEQRIRALDAFAHDAYGRRAAVAEGVIPARVVDGSDGYEPAVAACPPQPVRVAIGGLDVVRDPAGRFLVLEDNARTPSGLAYALAARRFSAQLGYHLDDVVDVEGAALAALTRVLDGAMVVTDGPSNVAFWEHQWLAQALGLPLQTLGDLDPNLSGLVYRRTDGDTLADADPRLVAAVRSGAVTCVNAFGNGVADDKLVHAYVEDLIRFYLGEEPVLGSVPTYDLSVPARLEEALDRLDEIVVKPRSAEGGRGVTVGPASTAQQRDEAAAAVRAAPEDWIAQDTVMLSRHLTVIDGELQPRHVDLRVFAVWDGARAVAIPGGLTRVALGAGDMIVNSSRGGGAKDTWVMRA